MASVQARLVVPVMMMVCLTRHHSQRYAHRPSLGQSHRPVVDAAGADAFEIFRSRKRRILVQLCAVSALGAPADLSYDEAVRKITALNDPMPDET